MAYARPLDLAEKWWRTLVVSQRWRAAWGVARLYSGHLDRMALPMAKQRERVIGEHERRAAGVSCR